MHYSWLAPDRVCPGWLVCADPSYSPPVLRRQAGSLPTRSWWPSTAGSVAVRAMLCGYWQGYRAGSPIQVASGHHGEGKGPYAMGSHSLG